jgi:hypothetical protein
MIPPGIVCERDKSPVLWDATSHLRGVLKRTGVRTTYGYARRYFVGLLQSNDKPAAESAMNNGLRKAISDDDEDANAGLTLCFLYRYYALLRYSSPTVRCYCCTLPFISIIPVLTTVSERLHNR